MDEDGVVAGAERRKHPGRNAAGQRCPGAACRAGQGRPGPARAGGIDEVLGRHDGRPSGRAIVDRRADGDAGAAIGGVGRDHDIRRHGSDGVAGRGRGRRAGRRCGRRVGVGVGVGAWASGVGRRVGAASGWASALAWASGWRRRRGGCRDSPGQPVVGGQDVDPARAEGVVRADGAQVHGRPGERRHLLVDRQPGKGAEEQRQRPGHVRGRQGGPGLGGPTCRTGPRCAPRRREPPPSDTSARPCHRRSSGRGCCRRRSRRCCRWRRPRATLGSSRGSRRTRQSARSCRPRTPG